MPTRTVSTPAPKRAIRTAPLAAAPVAAVTGPVAGNPLRPLILAALCLSLLLFAVAAAPLRVVPWRRAAYFVNDRHVDLTLVGIVFLVVAGLTMLFTHG